MTLRPLHRRVPFVLTLALAAVSAAAFSASSLAQSLAPSIDAGHSYAGLWMGRDTEVSTIVNVGVAQVGGTISLVPENPAASTLDFALVPGGQGDDMLSPEGALRPEALARLLRFSTMTFHSTRADVRRDGYLEFVGELSVTHVTREQIRPAWNSTYTTPSYTDPKIERSTGPATFVLVTPHAEFLGAYLAKSTEVLLSATVDAAQFRELPVAVLDAYWPAFAEDAECPSVNTAYGVRDNIALLCHGKTITAAPSIQPNHSFGVDYSGLHKNTVPPQGPVTIVLHLKLAEKIMPPSGR